jgi:two-component system NtrC family sensor kinase
MKMTLKLKLLLLSLVLSVSAATIFSVIFINHDSRILRAEIDDRASMLVDNLAKNCEYGLVTMNTDNLLQLAGNALQQKDVHAVKIFTNKGKILADVLNQDTVGPFRDYTQPVLTQKHSGAAEEALMLNINVKPEQAGEVIVTFTLDPMNRKLNGLKKAIITFNVAAILIIFILIMFVVENFVAAPVRELVDATKKITNGNFDHKVPVKSRDEIGMLGTLFNEMTENLGRSRMEIEEYNRNLEQKVEQRTNELMDSKQKLIQSNKLAAIGQLAGGVAHEINNPIGVILGFAQIVARDVHEGEPLYLPLRSIEREAIRCKKLVADLLTFSRISKVEKEDIIINDAIDQTLSLVEAQAKVKNVRIIREYSNSLPMISANKQQIQQVAINLCTNAMDSMPEGGTIMISTAAHTGFIELAVSDTGSGIPEDVKEHIFEPFFTTKEVGKGTGLGLSICYETVQRHNGTIEVESPRKDGTKGTAFIIKLPARTDSK